MVDTDVLGPIPEGAVETVGRMLTAHFSNQGLGHLIDEASAALGNPIVVVDPSFHYLAWHISAAPDDDRPAVRMLREEIENRAVVPDAIAYIKQAGLDERAGHRHVPLHFYNEKLGCDCLVGASTVHGICVAHTMMIALDAPFGEYDELCFQRLTLFVSQEIQKQPIFTDNRGQAKSYFLVDLLQNRQPSPEIIAQRLDLLDLRPRGTYVLIAMQPRQAGLTSMGLAALADRLQPIMNGAIYALYEGCFILLLTRTRDEGIGDYAMDLLHRCAQTDDLAVGVSNYFEDLADIQRYYAQATAAIANGETAAATVDDGSVYLFRNYAYMQMLDVCKRSADLANYIQPALLDLAAYDRDHGGDLMDTLFAYLQNACNTHRTADSLHIHKNTLLYRLTRIRKILGCSLSSGEDIFMLQLSFRVMMHLGMFYSRVPLDRDELAKG